MLDDPKILVPGETAPASAGKSKAPKPRVEVTSVLAGRQTPAAADDLAEFDGDELPPAPPEEPVPMSAVKQMLAAQAAKFEQQIAEAILASRSGQDPATAAKLAAARIASVQLPTQAEAAATCAALIAAGRRPSPILTVDGWFAHQELARTIDATFNTGG